MNKWIDHVYHHHHPPWKRILDVQREKKRKQTEQRLEAENILDNAIKQMDEVMGLEQVRFGIPLLCL